MLKLKKKKKKKKKKTVKLKLYKKYWTVKILQGIIVVVNWNEIQIKKTSRKWIPANWTCPIKPFEFAKVSYNWYFTDIGLNTYIKCWN